MAEKTKKSFQAIKIFTSLAKNLECSRRSILGLYSEDLAHSEQEPMNNPFKDSREAVLPPYSPKGIRRSRLEKDEVAFTPEQLSQLDKQVRALSDFLFTTPLQTLLIVAVYSNQVESDRPVDKRAITHFFRLNGVDWLFLQEDFQELVRKGYIKISRGRNRRGALLNPLVEKALTTNHPYQLNEAQDMSRYEFVSLVQDFVHERSDNSMPIDDLLLNVQELENDNATMPFVANVLDVVKSPVDRIIFYTVCHNYITDRVGFSPINTVISDIIDNSRDYFSQLGQLKSGHHPLIERSMVAVENNDFLNDTVLNLADEGRRILLREDYELLFQKQFDNRLVTPEKIADRKLFFDSSVNEQLTVLKNSLMEEQFVQLQERLKEHQMPTGVTVLMYGAPGTGKTASAEMLAKATGRAIYHVDIAESKSMWFGESEKLFKKIFTDYREMCAHSVRKPILLFNEADALFGKRRDVSAGNTVQTENSLQNILLEELEKLDGILIATTNLCDNLDSAFERRFLYKIKFGLPTTQAKQYIWKDKLQWLNDEESSALAAFSLSGGEIDNIVRKAIINEVLSGSRPDLEQMKVWCGEEKLTQGRSAAIGFSR